MLKNHYIPNILEAGIDEAGRGPLFGRIYAAAVILPKGDMFDHSLMRDSKNDNVRFKKSRSSLLSNVLFSTKSFNSDCMSLIF